MELIAELKDKKAEMASWRQHLHQFPEAAYEEEMTSDFVAEKLKSFGVEVHRGLGKTGVVGVIQGQDSGNGGSPSIGLRADMDALPMEEQTNLAYASRHANRMHACGHDGHTTMCSARRNIWQSIVILLARFTAFSSRQKRVVMQAQGP